MSSKWSGPADQGISEIDRADWFSLATAREKLLKGQRPILDKLLTHAQERHGEVNEGELSSKGFSEPSQSSLF